MPDQRMHDLWINNEGACGHKSCEVHDIRFIASESVCVLDADEKAEKLAVTRHPACPSDGSPPRDSPVESRPFVENDGRGSGCLGTRGTPQLARTNECFSTDMATA